MSEWPTVVAGLGGTALGATVTGGFAWLTEKSRRQHDLRTHWLDARRDVAVRFLDATEDVIEITSKLDNLMRVDEGGPQVMRVGGPQTREEAMDLLHEADVRVRALNTEIDLVGSEAERRAAKGLREAAWQAFSSNRVGPDGSGYSTYVEARSRFHEAVRAGLVTVTGAEPR